jgi:hypothetical protein
MNAAIDLIRDEIIDKTIEQKEGAVFNRTVEEWKTERRRTTVATIKAGDIERIGNWEINSEGNYESRIYTRDGDVYDDILVSAPGYNLPQQIIDCGIPLKKFKRGCQVHPGGTEVNLLAVSSCFSAAKPDKSALVFNKDRAVEVYGDPLQIRKCVAKAKAATCEA